MSYVHKRFDFVAGVEKDTVVLWVLTPCSLVDR
jgi:hypothetical protein